MAVASLPLRPRGQQSEPGYLAPERADPAGVTEIDLADGSWEREAPRLIADAVEYVVVARGFTINGWKSEAHDHESFKRRMRRFRRTLEHDGSIVTAMVIHRKPGHHPWCHFELVTPAFHLDRPERLSGVPRLVR